MSSIFDKINTLVNAQVNDFLGRNPKSPLARIKLNAEEADKNPRRSAQTLRQRLEEAIEYEDDLQATVDLIMREATDLDLQVDHLLQAGDEVGARRIQGQLIMKQRQLSIAESELRDHRLMTQHLMRELSTLEMTLDGQERREQATPGEASGGKPRMRIPVEGSNSAATYVKTKGNTIAGAVSDKLEGARTGLENLLNNAPVGKEPQPRRRFEKFEVVDEEPDPRRPKSRGQDKGHMNDRLSRLSKPDDDDS